MIELQISQAEEDLLPDHRLQLDPIASAFSSVTKSYPSPSIVESSTHTWAAVHALSEKPLNSYFRGSVHAAAGYVHAGYQGQHAPWIAGLPVKSRV
jgi:hypothetical protein